MKSLRIGCAIAVLTCAFSSREAFAAVTRVEITSRTDVPAVAASATGPYEKLVGHVFFALDPADAHNKGIVDIDKAPRNAAGRVEFSADLEVLAPKDRARGNDVALFDILNRGRRARDDDFLMSRGYTIVRVGWQFDTRREGLLGLDAPPVLEHGQPVTGRISTLLMPATNAALYALDDIGRYGDAARYPPVDPASPRNVLTVRDGFLARSRVVPRDMWRFVSIVDGKPAPGTSALSLDGGFLPGHVYELSYEATGAVVAGVGFAAVRDLASALKHGKAGPVAARYAYAVGNSQDGRYLREFMYEGFNADENGERAFDGIIAHIAGSSRSADFNGRFARPSGLAYFTASLFPYLDLDQRDPVTGRTDGIQMHLAPAQRPKIFYSNSSTEYWGGGRAAALTHTTLDGRRDVAAPDNVRMYFIAGTQHSPAASLSAPSSGAQKPNVNDYAWAMHALVDAMDRWVRTGAAPPPSTHPMLADNSLVTLARIRFPIIPGVRSPLKIPAGYRSDLPGPHEADRLPMLVPQVDRDGNEIAGIRLPTLAVPLATYTGWNFRSPAIGQPGELLPLAGSSIPFPVTRAERERTRDPRLSIEERYGSREHYRALVSEAAARLVQDHYLLEEDVPRVVDQALANWDEVVRGTPLAVK